MYCHATAGRIGSAGIRFHIAPVPKVKVCEVGVPPCVVTVSVAPLVWGSPLRTLVVATSFAFMATVRDAGVPGFCLICTADPRMVWSALTTLAHVIKATAPTRNELPILRLMASSLR